MKKILFLAVSAFMSVSAYCSNVTGQMFSKDEAGEKLVKEQGEQSLVLNTPAFDFTKLGVQGHYSHQSHSSHYSHKSHFSSR